MKKMLLAALVVLMSQFSIAAMTTMQREGVVKLAERVNEEKAKHKTVAEFLEKADKKIRDAVKVVAKVGNLGPDGENNLMSMIYLGDANTVITQLGEITSNIRAAKGDAKLVHIESLELISLSATNLEPFFKDDKDASGKVIKTSDEKFAAQKQLIEDTIKTLVNLPKFDALQIGQAKVFAAEFKAVLKSTKSLTEALAAANKKAGTEITLKDIIDCL